MGHREVLIGRRGGMGSNTGLPFAAVADVGSDVGLPFAAVADVGSDVGLPLACAGRDGLTGVDLRAEISVGPVVREDVGSLTAMSGATRMGSATGMGSAESVSRWVEVTSTARCRAGPLVVALVGVDSGR